MKRSILFASLFLVALAGSSVGVLIGDRLSGPEVVYAAPQPAAAMTGPAAILEEPLTAAPALVDPTLGFADVVDLSLPAVVSVTNTQRTGRSGGLFNFFNRDEDDDDEPNDMPTRGFGSGFIISSDGYVLTNNHVVEDSRRLSVKLDDDRTYEAEVIGTDPSIDLALLKLDVEGIEFPALRLGDSDSLRVGEWVIAIGSPLNFENSVTVGVVSAKNRSVPLESADVSLTNFIQTDAAINRGNSGGPLLDARGRVVGINTAIHRGDYSEGIGFALPINDVRLAVDQLRSSGRVQRGFLGIRLGSEIDATAAEYYGLDAPMGALISGVTPDQPAERAGLRPGDLILDIDGERVKDNDDLIRKISTRRPGERIEVVVLRDGRSVTKTVRLIERNRQSLRAETRRPFEDVEPQSAPDDGLGRAEGMGLVVENLDGKERSELGFDGVKIVELDYDTAAADALRVGLVIVSLNDVRTRNAAEWQSVVAGLDPGEAVKVEVGFMNGTQTHFLRVE